MDERNGDGCTAAHKLTPSLPLELSWDEAMHTCIDL